VRYVFSESLVKVRIYLNVWISTIIAMTVM